MRIFLSAVAAALFLLATAVAPHAARDTATSPGGGTASGIEILVFETDNCNYCPLIRTRVLPRYENSPRYKSIPMRFVDLNSVDVDKLNLNGPLRVVPTMVVMQDGSEVDRIGGYVGPSIFFQALAKILQRTGLQLGH